MTDADLSPQTRPSGSVARNALLLLGSQTVTWALSGATLLVLPRLFGVAAIGRLAIANAIWAVAGTLVSFGTTMYVTLESARRPNDVRSIVAQAVRLRILSACVVWALVAGFLLIVGYAADIVALVILVGVLATVGSLIEVANAALIGVERMGIVARSDMASRLATTVLMLAAAFITRSLFVTVAVGFAGSVVRAMMILPPLSRLPGNRGSARWSDARVVARRSSPFFVAGIALILYQQVDTIVMSILLDEREIGSYGAAILVFSTLLFAPNIVMTSLLPALTRERTRDANAAVALLARAFDTLVLIAIPIGLATAICAPAGIKLLYGAEFAPAGQVLTVLGFVLLFTFLSILLGSYAYATERQRFWNTLMVGSIFLSIPLDFVFVPWMERSRGNGAIGGALAYLVTELLLVVGGILYLVPQLLTRERGDRILRCGIAGAAMLLAGWPLRDQIVFLPGAVVLFVYLAVVLLLRVPNDAERAQARSILAAVTRRRTASTTVLDETPPVNDWALLTQLLSLREAERTMTPEGWAASEEVGRTVNASAELSRALGTHLGSWVGALARGAAQDERSLDLYRTLATTEANWTRYTETDAASETDRRTLLALLVVDAVRQNGIGEESAESEPADVAAVARRGQVARRFGQRMVDAGVLRSWEQVAELDEDDLARCLTEPAVIRRRVTGTPGDEQAEG